MTDRTQVHRAGRRRTAVLLTLLVAMFAAGGGVLAWRALRSSPATAHAGQVTPYRGSPVLLRVYNAYGAPIVVSAFAADRGHELADGGSLDIQNPNARPPWHVRITDAHTERVLYDERLTAGAHAVLRVGPSSVTPVGFDQADEDEDDGADEDGGR